MRLPADRFLPLSALALLAACGGATHSEVAVAPPAAGPGADYPIVVGQPFTIDGVTYVPADKMNVDQVGYAYAGTEGGSAVSAAHRTLPLPSYAEVTSLDTGKTILVRIERRGPMSGDGLIELSPGAVAQLGANASGKTPVRVRRVNPPEIERAALRSGTRAPERMETPKSLVAVLLRKLNPAAPVAAPIPESTPLPNLAAIAAAPKPVAAERKPRTTTPAKPTPPPSSAPASASTRAPTPAPIAAKPAASPATASRGGNVVQVGAFASKANAEASAAKLGGSVSASGRLWRVRMGPYAVHNDAAAALAKARGAGYSDARIQRAD
ncbi:MAG: SPOR domain-containing protein [Novosphingobium sp.]